MILSTFSQADVTEGNLGEPIDRKALVSRHNPHIEQILPMSPLQLGNGSMVFTADFTGLQTFPAHHDKGLPLQTNAGWAWNHFPNEKDYPYAAVMKDSEYQGRPYKAITGTVHDDVIYRGIIHRFNLGRIGLDLQRSNGESPYSAQISDINQKLDLWTGLATSRFNFDGVPVTVRTVIAPEDDTLAIKVDSPLVQEGRCNIDIEFPYPRGTKHLPTDLFEDSMVPLWFQKQRDEWELQEESIYVDILGEKRNFRVYKKHFPAGTHTFGGNNWQNPGLPSIYFPMVGDPGGNLDEDDFSFTVSTKMDRYRHVPGGVKVGQEIWTDRDYAMISVPENLQGLDMVMVSNQDEKVHSDEHMSFTLEKPMDIYLAWLWHPDRHSSRIIHQEFNKTDILREIDGISHFISIQTSAGVKVTQTGRNRYNIDLTESELDAPEVVINFGKNLPMWRLPDFTKVSADAATYWEKFWSTGGAIDLSGSTDPRAGELERRIVLSQYMTQINASGEEVEMPSGLGQLTYYGHMALEVTGWHRSHFPFWGRNEPIENVMEFYREALPTAQWIAQQRGFEGAEYTKGAASNGRPVPSFAPLYVSHTPNPIYFLESLYRNNPDPEFLQKWAEIVFEVATFIVSTMKYDEVDGHYDLGPPIEPQQEGFHSNEIVNPTFELAYLIWGLETAQLWRKRLGMEPDERWQHVIDNAAPLPSKDGLYLVSENFDDTWENPKRRSNHIAFLNTYGFLPAVHGVDVEIMRQTLRRTLEPDGWNWPNSFSINFGHIAMCAARVGEPEEAINILFREVESNQWQPTGSVPMSPRGVWSIRTLPSVNGNLLLAVAMMAAGWEGAPDKHAPGFPEEGWRVRWEGLKPYF